MSTEILDVVDTAVKIGLGALISGISTYWVTSSNHKNEARKESDIRSHNVIAAAAGHADEFIRGLTGLIAAIDGVRRSYPNQKHLNLENPNDKRAWDFIFASDEEFCKARANSIFASSKLHLVGLSETALLLDKLDKLSYDIREMVMFQKHLPDDATVDIWRAAIKEHRTEFFRQLSKYYNT